VRKFWLLLVVSVSVQWLSGQTQENNRDKYDPASGRDASIQSHREGFFSFVTKMVNPKDIDFGELIAERRQALADASVANPYFWYGAGSTMAVLVLLFALYVKILEGNSFRWRSAEVIARHNRNMSDCNRVIEAGVAGRALPGTVLGQDMERTVYSLRQELDASDEENRRLKQQLQEKKRLFEI
jgi:hypothetical protein